jgi:hypothetical protein
MHGFPGTIPQVPEKIQKHKRSVYIGADKIGKTLDGTVHVVFCDKVHDRIDLILFENTTALFRSRYIDLT